MSQGSCTIWKYALPVLWRSAKGRGKDKSHELSPFSDVKMGRSFCLESKCVLYLAPRLAVIAMKAVCINVKRRRSQTKILGRGSSIYWASSSAADLLSRALSRQHDATLVGGWHHNAQHQSRSTRTIDWYQSLCNNLGGLWWSAACGCASAFL